MNIKTNIVKVASRTALVLKKNSPIILTGVGIVGVVTSGVLACKATLKAEEILDEHQEKMETIKKAEETGSEKYTEEDIKKDKAKVYARTIVNFAKLYGPSIALGAASIGCLIGGQTIMQRRNAALMVSYNLVNDAFSAYRKRVVDDLGEDKDKEYRYGVKKQVVVSEIEEDGKKKKVKETIDVVESTEHSMYSKFFDEASSHWQPNPEYNLVFLKAQQNYMNDLLKIRGHVFLNEVYDALDIPRTSAGSVVGWVLSKDGDNYIDFGIFDKNNCAARKFVNGTERNILLDFNVDGVIYDLI